MDLVDDDIVFEKVYNQTLRGLEARTKISHFDLQEIENELDGLYIYQGNNWTGRSAIGSAEIEASIAAYQVFIHQLRQKSSL